MYKSTYTAFPYSKAQHFKKKSPIRGPPTKKMSNLDRFNVSSILDAINATTAALGTESPQSRVQLLNLSRQLTAALESPSEFIQRIGWAEVRFPGFVLDRC